MIRILLLAGAETAVINSAYERAVLQQWQRDLISLRVRCSPISHCLRAQRPLQQTHDTCT